MANINQFYSKQFQEFRILWRQSTIEKDSVIFKHFKLYSRLLLLKEIKDVLVIKNN